MVKYRYGWFKCLPYLGYCLCQYIQTRVLCFCLSCILYIGIIRLGVDGVSIMKAPAPFFLWIGVIWALALLESPLSKLHAPFFFEWESPEGLLFLKPSTGRHEDILIVAAWRVLILFSHLLSDPVIYMMLTGLKKHFAQIHFSTTEKIHSSVNLFLWYEEVEKLSANGNFSSKIFVQMHAQMLDMAQTTTAALWMLLVIVQCCPAAWSMITSLSSAGFASVVQQHWVWWHHCPLLALPVLSSSMITSLSSAGVACGVLYNYFAMACQRAFCTC